MLFRRRTPPHWLERLRVALWPRHSFGRSAKYFTKRVLRLTATPHAVAIGFASGACASFTPFVGFHFLLAFLFAFLVGGNMLASAIGTAVGNPITFPFIWTSTYRLGAWMLGTEATAHNKAPITLDLLHQSVDAILPIFKPMLIGSLPLGLLTGIMFYFIIYGMVKTYQVTRREKLLARRNERRDNSVPVTSKSIGENAS